MEKSAYDLFSYISQSSASPAAVSKDALSREKQNFERSILEPCQHPVFLNPTDQPCSHFFQQRGAIDFNSYLRLKREERHSVLSYHAAVKIQACWRGFLIRDNWRILVESATRIQAWIRGYQTRKKWRHIYNLSMKKRQEELRNRAATKIQAAWRGYLSRKNKFDFAQYKKIQEKNEALRRSIERINELEAALLKTLDPHGSGSHESAIRSDSSHISEASQERIGVGATATFVEEGHHGVPKRKSKQRLRTGSGSETCGGTSYTPSSARASPFDINLQNMSPSLENFIIEKFPELLHSLSESRIAELYAYLANLETEMKAEKELEALVRKLGGIHKLTLEQADRLEESRRAQRQRANLILDLAKLIIMDPLKAKLLERDSVDAMFPPVPDRPDLIQTDSRKVRALKDAIRMFRQQAKAKEEEELQKKHVLLRTKACPGVLSDIYTTELTDIECKLKSLKFWKGSLQVERAAKRAQQQKDKRLKQLFRHALKIGGTSSSSAPGEQSDLETEEDYEDYEEHCGEELGPEDDDDSEGPCYFLQPLDPHPPPPTPDGEEAASVTNEEKTTADNIM